MKKNSIKNIYVFANYNMACTDETGQQVVPEQGNLLIEKLKDMLKRKVVTPSTIVCSSWSESECERNGLPVGKILNIKGYV